MARRNVVVRALAAVEGLGACTVIASDKTGTLTQNRLSVERVVLPGGKSLIIGPDLPDELNAPGAASHPEIVIFVLSLAAGLPMPLSAVQLLWFNLSRMESAGCRFGC